MQDGRLGQQPALDGVRAIAIGFVVLFHAEDVVHYNDRWFPGGFLGVDLFFVLSGFLITRLLLEERALTGRLSVRRFYGRRAARLLPALALFLVAHVMWVATGGFRTTAAHEAESVAYVLLYISNWSYYFGNVPALGLGHLWSLSVEEQFYVVWPFVFLAAARRPRLLGAVILLGITSAVVVRMALWNGSDNWGWVYFRTDARMDSLLVGAGLAIAHASGALDRIPARVRQAGALVGLLCLAASVVTLGLRSAILYSGGWLTVVAVASAMVLAGVIDQRWWLTDLLSMRIPRVVGRVSYALYLWHSLVMMWVNTELDAPAPWVTLSISAVITTALVAASWFFVEQPILRWSRRRFARPGSSRAQMSDQSSGLSSVK